jgi:signal transduction histidine kinase
MTAAPSLTRRLIVYILLVEFAGAFVAWSASYALELSGIVGNFDVQLSDYAYNHVRQLVLHSLARGPDGSLRIVPTPDLRARAERSPDLQFAVFESLEQPAIPGSSGELSALLHKDDGKLRNRGQRFLIAGKPGKNGRGYLRHGETSYGPLFVGASGYDLVWTDWFYMLNDDIGFTGAFVVVVAIASTAATWCGVRRALAPLRRIASDARRIDMGSLGQGIDPTGAPSEVRPLIDAMNESLLRVDASVMRMRRYTANAAHELRTPLAILRARLQNAEEPSFKTDLEQDVSRLQTIIEQLLITARLGEGQASIDEEVDLVESVWAVVAGRTPLAIRCGRQIEFETIGAHCRIRGNAQAIASVVGNLIDNALRAEPEGGVVLTRVDGERVEVIDHGAGVPVGEREMIFEPFWRKSETTPGTGLGLSIARELMEKHDGRIRVEETPGGGATFELRFPRSRGADALAASRVG